VRPIPPHYHSDNFLTNIHSFPDVPLFIMYEWIWIDNPFSFDSVLSLFNFFWSLLLSHSTFLRLHVQSQCNICTLMLMGNHLFIVCSPNYLFMFFYQPIHAPLQCLCTPITLGYTLTHCTNETWNIKNDANKYFLLIRVIYTYVLPMCSTTQEIMGLFGWWGKWGKFTPNVPNMWGKCGGANVLPPPPQIPFTPKR
jgi:hypothetical protein